MLRRTLSFNLLFATSLVLPLSAAEPAPGPAAAAPTAKDLRFDDPAVRSILEDHPSTPAELVRAVTLLIELDRPELAKPLLAKLVDMKLDAKALAALAENFDSAVFMRLARTADLGPQATEFADAVLAAAAQARRNPAHLAGLIGRLADPSDAVRRRAAGEIRAAREAAVGPLLAALADPARKNLHPAVLAVFTQFGEEVVGPLAAALQSPDDVVAAAAAHALGQIRSSAATADLLAVAITSEPHTAIREAASETLERILGHQPTLDEKREFFRSDIQRLLEWARKHRSLAEATDSTWHWDSKLGGSVRVEMPAADLAVETAGRYGHALAKIADGISDERLALLAELMAAKYAAPNEPLASGPGTPRAAADQLGVAVVEGVLIEAQTRGYTWAATAAAEILGDVGSQELLATQSAAPSPLAQAVRSGDRRLRFAAVDSILRFHPTRSFTGAGTIVDALSFFAATTGSRRALVGHPRLARAEELASLLATLGYVADVATNSRQLMDLASHCPDYELALVDVSLAGPPVDDMIGRLRRDPRTFDLPIGVMVGDDQRKAAERMAATMPWVLAIPRIADEPSLRFEVDRIREVVGRDLVPHEARQAQAAAALAHLANLADFSGHLFLLDHVTPAVERALYVPAFTPVAARVLADLPDATAQRILVDLASATALPLETREIGAVAFGRSVRRHGVDLTGLEIKKQYDRYNAGRLLDEGTLKILGSILDTIENRANGPEPPEPGR
ncbi:MAG TPA: HEAT repeat domain-containing protein [Pirellulales bacterium]|nr:HEAT repeat domain-containing protein [Pirellulales bacterium]